MPAASIAPQDHPLQPVSWQHNSVRSRISLRSNNVTRSSQPRCLGVGMAPRSPCLLPTTTMMALEEEAPHCRLSGSRRNTLPGDRTVPRTPGQDAEASMVCWLSTSRHATAPARRHGPDIVVANQVCCTSGTTTRLSDRSELSFRSGLLAEPPEVS